ncbi:MAG: hypothetical protein OCD76_14350 [Reichenbachiella sp.]
MMKKIKAGKVGAILFLAVLISSFSYGQNSGGSIYSIFGIGELTPTMSVQAQGMGNAAIGLTNQYYTNTSNAAANDMLSSYSNHNMDIGLYYKSINYNTSDASDQSSTGGLSNLNFWFKITDRWNSMVGLNQYSNIGYSIKREGVSYFDNAEFDVLYEGDGGLSEFHFSNGVRLFNNLSVGLKLAFIFGNINHSESISSSQFAGDYVVENTSSIKDIYAEYSLNYRWDLKKSHVNFALIYKPSNTLAGNVNSTIVDQQYLYDEDEGVIYEEASYSNDYVIPMKIGGGISFTSEKWIVSTEVQFNQWSQGLVLGYEDQLVDTWKYGVGLEWTPSRYSEHFLKRVSYRTGAYYENSYLIVNDHQITKYAFTGGLALPLKSGNTVNLSYQWINNGTTNYGLIQESTNQVTFNLSIRNRWFQRRKYN